MAKAEKTAKTARRFPRLRRGLRRVRGLVLRGVLIAAVLVLALVLALRFVPPPINIYQAGEWWRLGAIERDWVARDGLPDFVALSAAAAEDANFCTHPGFDLAAIRAALADDTRLRGGSTITQQTAKNVFLWHARSWPRKALEAGFAALIEAIWGKWRIMEVYLNVAEFDTGVFGVEAAARHHFGVPAAGLTRRQAALLMAVLPDPKGRSAVRPSAFVQRRAASIADGARTLAGDGRGACVMG